MGSKNYDKDKENQRKFRHKLKHLIQKGYDSMKFLVDENKNDTSKVDIMHDPLANYDNLIKTVIGHYTQL
mgnify:CR=1 FL=1